MTAKQYNAMVDYIHTFEWKNEHLTALISLKDFPKFISAFKLKNHKVSVFIDNSNVTFTELNKFLYDYTDMREDEILAIFPPEGIENNEE